MQKFSFVKMEAAGGDYIIVDNREDAVPGFAKAKLARDMCRRAQGIGADGMIYIEFEDEDDDAEYDFAWDFLLADGERGLMCPDAARCAARFANIFGLAGRQMTFSTAAGPVKAELTATGVKIRLPGSIHHSEERFNLPAGPGGPSFDTYLYKIHDQPRALVPVRDPTNLDVRGWGRELCRNPVFGPEGADVDFMARSEQFGVALRTYSRRAGDEALVSSNGALAAAVGAAHILDMNPPLVVSTHGGVSFGIAFAAGGGAARDIWLEGPARLVFTGKTFWPNEGTDFNFSELILEMEP